MAETNWNDVAGRYSDSTAEILGDPTRAEPRRSQAEEQRPSAQMRQRRGGEPMPMWGGGDVSAIPLGDPADPISQLAFLLAPYLVPELRALGAASRSAPRAGTPPGTSARPQPPASRAGPVTRAATPAARE